MKLGIFSDVHGNLDALEAALDFFDTQQVTEYLCLGDLVGYGAEPEECVRLLRKLRCVMVAGNHDYGVGGKTPIDSFNPDAREALLWTQRHMTLVIRDFLGSLELVEIIPAHSFRLVHGSPSAPRRWDYVLDWSDIEYEFDFFSDRVCLLGHTHVPFAARHGPTSSHARLIESRDFELLTNGTSNPHCMAGTASTYLGTRSRAAGPASHQPTAMMGTMPAAVSSMGFTVMRSRPSNRSVRPYCSAMRG